MMSRTAIILAGGNSQRFGAEKGLADLAGKPLILHVIGKIRDLVDEVIVCVKTNEQSISFSSILPDDSKIAIDAENLPTCPLTGVFTGLEKAKGEYSIILPCDTPFLSRKLADLMFDIAAGVSAVIPRWPNGYLEPLQAVYRTKSALEATKETLKEGKKRLRCMISLLKRVRYLSTLVIKEIDPNMLTFFNINMPIDLKKAETIIKKKYLQTDYKDLI